MNGFNDDALADLVAQADRAVGVDDRLPARASRGLLSLLESLRIPIRQTGRTIVLLNFRSQMESLRGEKVSGEER